MLFTAAVLADPVGRPARCTFGGLFAFGWQWWNGGRQVVFLTKDSTRWAPPFLLGLLEKSFLALACPTNSVTPLATKHGRRAGLPAAGVSGLFRHFRRSSCDPITGRVVVGDRRARLLVTAAGNPPPDSFAGRSVPRMVGLAVPEAAPWCFKLSFAWEINRLFKPQFRFLALERHMANGWLGLP